MNWMSVSWKMFQRHWSAGELLVLLLALIVGVAAITAVGSFTDRIRLVLEKEAGELLAADLSLSSKNTMKPSWQQQAERMGLRTARFTELRSVIVVHDQAQLVEAKAVDAAYPLRGILRTSATVGETAEPSTTGPAAGKAWPDATLAGRLQLKPGDRLQFGTLSLQVDRILQYEPDRAGNIFNIAPRLMVNLQDLSRSGLLGPGALKKDHLLLAGATATVKQYQQWIESRIGPAETLRSGRNARPELSSALQRAEQFLGLASLVAVLLAGVAIAMAAHRHARRHFDAVAVMRCMGARGSTILKIFSMELILLGIIASAIGSIFGYMAQEVLAQLLQGLFSQNLPPPTFRPVLFGFGFGMALLLGFALPPIVALRHVPPLRVLRRALEPDLVGHGAKFIAIAVALLLCIWQAGETTLAMMVIGGAMATILLLTTAAWLMLKLLHSVRSRSAVSWRYGIANLSRRSTATIAQIVAFGLGIMAMLLLTLVRTDLLETWQQQLPLGTSNTFLINVQMQQTEQIRAFLTNAGIKTPQFHPMMKGRLVAINDRPVSEQNYQQDRAQRLIKREFNLSWASSLDSDNHITQGSWWNNTKADMQWSVEEGLAKTLGIKHGDMIQFNIAGEIINAQVSNLRKVSWDSFRVNFFVLAPPGYLPIEQASYITSFHLPVAMRHVGGELLHQFPTITMIDVEEIMQRIRTVISRVAQAVEFVFIFTLLAGLTVLFAAMQSSQDERMREVAVLRTLGASNATIRRALLTEFGIMGLLSGLLAATAASAIAWLLATEVFHMEWAFNPTIWWVGLLVGGTTIPLAGLLSARKVMNTPPLLVLRQQ